MSFARRFAYSYPAGVILAAVLVALSEKPGWDSFSFLLAPGIVGGALVFPDGIHSDHPIAFFVVAAVAETLALAAMIALIWNYGVWLRQNVRSLAKPSAKN